MLHWQEMGFRKFSLPWKVNVPITEISQLVCNTNHVEIWVQVLE